MNLTTTQNRDYYPNIAAQSAIRIGVLNQRRTHRHQSGFFVSKAWQVLMGGPCGELKSSPVPLAGTPTCTVPLTLIGVRIAEVKNRLQRTIIMSNKSNGQVTPALNTIETALINAIDQTTLAHNILSDLSSIFTAIRKNTTEFEPNHRLAGIGQYLADDWANLLDCQAEELNTMMEVKS